MTSLINGFLFAINNSLPASIIAKATVAMILGLTGVWLARKQRAALRHVLLAATFGVLLVVPVASVVAPPIRITTTATAEKPVARALEEAVAGIPLVAATGEDSRVQRSAIVPLSTLLLAGWIAGALILLAPVVIGLAEARSIRRAAVPWTHGQSVVDRLALDRGMHRHVTVLAHEALPGPMTYGLVNPIIVLPADAETWAEEDLNRALVHELEHVFRSDWASQSVACILRALYWFHPLVWIACRQLALEAERACDDAVVGQSDAAAYANQLVELAQRLSLATKSERLLAMANRAHLAARIGAMLDNRQRRGRAGRLPVVLAWVAAAALVVIMPPIRMVAAPQDSNTHGLSVNAQLVIEDVTVSNQNGDSVEGLAAGDFSVAEDGVPQAIGIFEFRKATRGPVASYYVIGYYPTNQNPDGKFRRIRVTLKKDVSVKLDYRAGYYAKMSAGVVALTGRAGNGSNITRDIQAPALIYKKDPEYSEAARKAKYQGTVILGLEVNATGEVGKIQVVRSLGLGLDEKAIEAVQVWRFRPGTRDGRSVSVQTEVEVTFRLL